MAGLILCAVDDSGAAGGVLDTARWLADGLGSRVDVVHVVGDAAIGGDEPLGRVRAQLADEHLGVRPLTGSPAEAIRQTANREDAELIVVGSRGRGPLRSAAMGSVSRALVTEARCPVVVVPPGSVATEASGSPGDSASVVCGVDGSDQALAGAALAGRLAQRLGYRLVVVHARQNVSAVLSYPGARSETPPVTGQEDAVAKLAAEVVQRAVEAAGVDAASVIEPGPPAEILEFVANREAARLIVVSGRGLGGIRTSLLGSVVVELTAAAARPVVVLSEAAASAARDE